MTGGATGDPAAAVHPAAPTRSFAALRLCEGKKGKSP